MKESHDDGAIGHGHGEQAHGNSPGCLLQGKHDDLQSFIRTARDRPNGEIRTRTAGRFARAIGSRPVIK
jgi:hypothetical protein